MRTRLQLWNPRTIARLVKEGRGQGHGKTYLPWLTVRDVSTRGLACRVLGHVTGRTHHLLSWHLELAYFYVLDWSHDGDRRGRVTDIREQFPLLPLDETLRIATALGIAHPADPRTGRPIVMTTDFLISVGTGRGRSELARSTKPADQLTLRFAEKFEIERRYWAARGVECLIVTEREIPRVITDNLAILHPFADFPRRAGLPAARIDAIAAALTRRMALGDTSLAAVAGACDESFGLAPGTGLAVAHHLLATQQWNIDLTVPYHPRALLAVRHSALRPVATPVATRRGRAA